MKAYKTMKKLLSVALAFAMVAGIAVLPTYARPTDTKTFTLMDNDMTANVVGWVNKDTASDSYDSGNGWGYLFAPTGYSPYITVEDGSHVISSNPSNTSYGEVTIFNKMLTLNPPYQKSSLRFTYDITTGNKLTTQVIQIRSKIGVYSDFNYKNDNTAQVFSYNAAECAVVYYDDGQRRTIQLEENTDYTVVADIIYNGTNYDLTVSVKQNGETLLGGSYQMLGWASNVVKDVKDIKKVLYQIERLATSETVEEKDLFKFNNIKVENTVVGDILNFGEIEYDVEHMILDEPMGNLNLSAIAATNTADEGYIAGNKWASTTSDRENITPAFEVNGEYLYANLVNNGDSTKYTDRLYKRFDKIENGDNLVLSGYINLPAEGRAKQRHSLMLTIGSGDNLESNTYSAFRFVTTEHHNKHALFGLEKNPSNFSSDEADYPYGDGVTLRDWGWWNYHTEKDDVLYSGKDVPFTLTLTPDTNDSNYYDAQIKIGANDDYVGTRKIPASEATAFDRLTITLKQFNTATTANYVGLKDLKIIKSQGHFGLAEGNNKLSIDYTNIRGGAFSSDILFVERDADDNTIVNVTVVRNENVLNESGTLICDFEIMNSGAKIDVYILNSIDGMILLSQPKTFDVTS